MRESMQCGWLLHSSWGNTLSNLCEVVPFIALGSQQVSHYKTAIPVFIKMSYMWAFERKIGKDRVELPGLFASFKIPFQSLSAY